MQLELLLPPDLDAETLHHPQGAEGVEDVPVADAVLATTEHAHLHPTLAGRHDPLKDHRIHELGMLDPEGGGGRIDHPRHLTTAVEAAPDQPHIQARLEETAFPVGLEAGDDLIDHLRIVADHAVVAGLGEVLVSEVEGGDQGGMAVDHHRLLMGHREGLAGPGHGDAPSLQQGVGLVVPAVTPGRVGVEHHPHAHTALMRPQQRLLHNLALQLELLEQQLLTGLIDQVHHRCAAVIGHHQQALTGAGDLAHGEQTGMRTF